MNSISSVACVGVGWGQRRIEQEGGEEEGEEEGKGEGETYAEHAAHAETLHLAEAPEGLFGDVLDQGVEGALEEGRSRRADLGVNTDEVHERLVDVWPYFYNYESQRGVRANHM